MLVASGGEAMLKLVTAIFALAVTIAITAVLALLMGSAFAAASQSKWWKKWALSEAIRLYLGSSGSPYGDQGSQREATLRKKGSNDSSGSDDARDDGGGGSGGDGGGGD
jgi:hypothetical protein